MKILLGFPLLFLFIILVGVLIFLAWSLLLGWLLTMIFSFTHFEGSLLVMVASGMSLHVFSQLTGNPMSGGFEMPDADSDMWEDEDYEIPTERFFKNEKERTWAAWYRYQLTNAIYEDLKYTDNSPAKLMDDTQMQELAIRLGEIGFEIIKAKSPRTSKLRVSLADFQKHMKSQNLKPYDDPILETAVEAVNLTMRIPLFQQVFQEKLWDTLATIIE